MLLILNLRSLRTAFLMPLLWAILACLLYPPPETLANGPIPFFENFNGFTGTGFDPNPAPGQLDSNLWIMTGLSDGSLIFGDSRTSGDFARGSSAGGVTTGGVYAFDVDGSGNIILGVQPTASDFTPGEIVLRLQNTTGATITGLDINYDIWHLNNADRANLLNFSYSPDDSDYTTVPSLDFVTPQAADGLGWQSTSRSTILTGLTIADGDLFYLKWTGDDVGGSGSRDEYGLDEVQIAVPTGDTPPAVVSTTPVDGAANIAIDANLELNFNEAITVAGDWFQIDCGSSGLRSVVDTVVTGGPTTWLVDPNTDFANGETCTVTVFAAQVTDQDGAIDNMAADYTFSFTIVAAAGGLVINEIHADPDATLGDANNDGGVNTTQDEFVEIVNNTGRAVDISGWTLADGVGVRHTFSAGTVVPDQCAVLVFGGGTPTGMFGGAVVQTAGTLGLNNGGDTITLNDGSADQASYTYGGEGGDNQSLTRDPDITGAEPLLRHSTATGSGGALFSAGTRLDGSPFPGCGGSDTPPSVVNTTPVNNAVDVSLDANLELGFSEAVTVVGDWFQIACNASGTRHVADTVVSGGPTTWLIDPNTGFANGETCTVTVFAAQVTDQDGAPDNLAVDYVFNFNSIVSPAPARLLISEFLYDGLTPSSEGDEFIELCNPNAAAVDLTNYKVGDEETSGSGESMYYLPPVSLGAEECLVIAKDTAQFEARFGFGPDFEAGALTKYTAWSSGSWSLANSGDELLVLGPNDEILDSVAYANGNYATLGLEPDASAPEPYSLQRVWPTDTDSMPHDFVRRDPNPGVSTEPPSPPVIPPPAADLPGGMKAYWGGLHAHSSYSDGAGPPFYALAVARAAGLHFYGITDHGWWLSQAEWDRTLPQVISATVPGQFVALRGVEWTHDTSGHLNIFNSNTLLRKTDPQFDTLPELYTWLAANPTVVAQFNHPDPSYGGTFDNFAYNADAASQIFMQEIGNHAQGYRTYEPSFVQSNAVGWKIAPTTNGDTHSANWGSDTIGRTGIVAPALTEADLLDAMRTRRVFSTEDSNLAVALRSNEIWMGSVLTTTGIIPLTVDVVDPDPEPFTLYLYDGNLLLATAPFTASTAQWSTTVEARPGHFFWVKVVQADGNTAYSAPLWLDGQLEPEPLTINEILPAPNDWDWDGDGTADFNDEWLELYNPLDRSVGLGGWRLVDASGSTYDVPLGVTIPARGFATFYYTQTKIALNNGGDSLSLIHPNGTRVDSVAYDHSPGYDESWCRLPDGHSDWSDDCGPSPNAANWEKAPAGPLTAASIYAAKRLTPNAWVRVEGQVTAPPGVLGSRVMYIQDESAGIMIYLPQDHGLYFELGEDVEVVGNLRTFHEEFEIVVDERSDVKSNGPGAPRQPLPIVTTSLLEPYEGMLVMLQGRAVRFKGSATFWVDDGTDPARVYLKRSTGIRKPFIEPGTFMTVVGLVSQYSDQDNPSREDYRLLPRFQTDLQLPAKPAVPANWPTMLPETGH